MAKLVLGKSVCSDWFFRGQDRTVFMKAVYFCFGKKPANSKFATKTAKNKQKKNCEIVILHSETTRKS